MVAQHQGVQHAAENLEFSLFTAVFFDRSQEQKIQLNFSVSILFVIVITLYRKMLNDLETIKFL